jgi:hypothetical protein
MGSQREFLERMSNKDPDLILKIVKCVLSAVKRKRKSIDIFEVTFKNTEQMTFSCNEESYMMCLNSYMNDLIEMEEYELCAEIQKLNEKKTRKRKLIENGKEEKSEV